MNTIMYGQVRINWKPPLGFRGCGPINGYVLERDTVCPIQKRSVPYVLRDRLSLSVQADPGSYSNYSRLIIRPPQTIGYQHASSP